MKEANIQPNVSDVVGEALSPLSQEVRTNEEVEGAVQCTESVALHDALWNDSGDVCPYKSGLTTKKGTKLRIADFVHGTDGLGNQNFPPPKGKPIDQQAASFLVQQANLFPGEVIVVALGLLTNIALAIQLDPGFPKKIGQIVILGGAFSVNGNVNPAAEANIFGDPDAADIVFISGADILAVGINVTHQVFMSGALSKSHFNDIIIMYWFEAHVLPLFCFNYKSIHFIALQESGPLPHFFGR
ncbi:probable uridine nucleosidase 2 [Magnolia sinica]|uniref:probable uridine nucleosidase 2 n=1 Tax=Magnolia sinica TaxID=86752 RepID=UPI00265B4CEC|nr:probable uridine nucleosidase 2 [Magnolia sinica]